MESQTEKCLHGDCPPGVPKEMGQAGTDGPASTPAGSVVAIVPLPVFLASLVHSGPFLVREQGALFEAKEACHALPRSTPAAPCHMQEGAAPSLCLPHSGLVFTHPGLLVLSQVCQAHSCSVSGPHTCCPLPPSLLGTPLHHSHAQLPVLSTLVSPPGPPPGRLSWAVLMEGAGCPIVFSVVLLCTCDYPVHLCKYLSPGTYSSPGRL